MIFFFSVKSCALGPPCGKWRCRLLSHPWPPRQAGTVRLHLTENGSEPGSESPPCRSRASVHGGLVCRPTAGREGALQVPPRSLPHSEGEETQVKSNANTTQWRPEKGASLPPHPSVGFLPRQPPATPPLERLLRHLNTGTCPLPTASRNPGGSGLLGSLSREEPVVPQTRDPTFQNLHPLRRWEGLGQAPAGRGGCGHHFLLGPSPARVPACLPALEPGWDSWLPFFQRPSKPSLPK